MTRRNSRSRAEPTLAPLVNSHLAQRIILFDVAVFFSAGREGGLKVVVVVVNGRKEKKPPTFFITLFVLLLCAYPCDEETGLPFAVGKVLLPVGRDPHDFKKLGDGSCRADRGVAVHFCDVKNDTGVLQNGRESFKDADGYCACIYVNLGEKVAVFVEVGDEEVLELFGEVEYRVVHNLFDLHRGGRVRDWRRDFDGLMWQVGRGRRDFGGLMWLVGRGRRDFDGLIWLVGRWWRDFGGLMWLDQRLLKGRQFAFLVSPFFRDDLGNFAFFRAFLCFPDEGVDVIVGGLDSSCDTREDSSEHDEPQVQNLVDRADSVEVVVEKLSFALESHADVAVAEPDGNFPGPGFDDDPFFVVPVFEFGKEFFDPAHFVVLVSGALEKALHELFFVGAQAETFEHAPGFAGCEGQTVGPFDSYSEAVKWVEVVSHLAQSRFVC